MTCKFCHAEMKDDRKICPECGKRQDVNGAPAGEESQMPKQQKKETWKLGLLIAGVVMAIGVLAVVLLEAFGLSLFRAQDIYYKDTYVKKINVVLDKADTVVSDLCDEQLTNALLQVFCVEEFDAFLAEYYSYISYIGLDMTKPLSQQTCYFDKTMTWEQFMIQAGIESWQSYVMMGSLAKQDGFTFNEEWQEAWDKLPQDMETQAKENKFESAEAMLQYRYGKACSMDVYMTYARLVFTANAYYSSKLEVTEEEIDAAFTRYETEFAGKGITKTSALVSSVRHILIEPEGGKASDDGKTIVYSDAEWAACLAKAEQVLDEWKNGAATEDSFKELVTKYTADTASKSNGGLYEGIKNDGTYMKEFQDWAINTERKQGEVALVKTAYGYHVMYFVKGEGEWIYYSREKVRSENFAQMQERIDATKEANPLKVKYSKIVLEEIYRVEE